MPCICVILVPTNLGIVLKGGRFSGYWARTHLVLGIKLIGLIDPLLATLTHLEMNGPFDILSIGLQVGLDLTRGNIQRYIFKFMYI